MAGKKIRCICGKIYAPASHPVCPECQTPCPDSTPLPPSPDSPAAAAVVEDKLPIVPPERRVMLDSDRKKRPWNYVQPPRRFALYASLVGLLAGGWIILRPQAEPHDPTPKPAEKISASGTPGTPSTPQPAAAIPVPAENLAPVSPKDLAAEIAKAKPGATIKLAAGTYRSGFTIDRPIHLIGDSTGGPVIIESDNLGALQINAADVTLENLRFTGQPGGYFAIVKVLDKAALELRQCGFEMTGKFGVGAVGTAKFSAIKCTFSTGGQGTGCQLEDDSRAEWTDCLFKNNRWGCTIRQTAQGKAMHCQFQQNGVPDQAGYSMGATGEKTYAMADHCTFTDNPRGVIANEGSHFILKGCTFKNTGVTDEPDHITFGTVNANTGGQFQINDCTFDSNRQGLVVQSGGSAQVENCNFTNTGLRDARKSLVFFCNSVSAQDEGSKISLYKTNIRQSLQNGINLVEGVSLKMEDCEVSGGLVNGLGVGAHDKQHSEVTVVNCRFLNNKADGVHIAPDSVLKISKSSISGNGLNGIFVSGDKATVAAEECEINRNGQCGILGTQKAFSVLDTCTLQGNLYGAQNGLPKAKDGSGMFLKNCTVSDSRAFGAGALDGSLTLDDCTFTNNKKNLYKTGGLLLEQSSGQKRLPSDQKTGLEPTPQTGGKTGMAETAPAADSTNGEPDSALQKKRPLPKRKAAPSPASNKAEEILRNVRRYVPF